MPYFIQPSTFPHSFYLDEKRTSWWTIDKSGWSACTKGTLSGSSGFPSLRNSYLGLVTRFMLGQVFYFIMTQSWFAFYGRWFQKWSLKSWIFFTKRSQSTVNWGSKPHFATYSATYSTIQSSNSPRYTLYYGNWTHSTAIYGPFFAAVPLNFGTSKYLSNPSFVFTNQDPT
jgi:hypothetical protein